MSSVTNTSGIINAPNITVSPNEYELLRLQKDAGSEIIKNIRDILRDEDINFTEDLANSFSLVMWQGKAWVESSNRYASLVDRGMKPGKWVNFDALYDWVRIKLDIDEEPEATNVTWKILNKIHNKGIEPTRFAKKALKRLIGEHGAISLRRSYNKRGNKSRSHKIIKHLQKIGKKFGKVIRSTSKTLRKIKRTLNKTNNNINKVIKPIRRYK